MAKKCRDCGGVNPKPLNPRCLPCHILWTQSDEGIEKVIKDYKAGKERKAKRERKKLKERKEGLMSLSEWKKKIQTEFNKYIRLRDKDLPCISCQRHHQGQYHAGHYRPVGGSPERLRYDERNCHKQCAPCNNHKSGNLNEYRIHLVKKIGLPRVEWIEGDHEPLHLTIPEAKDLLKYWRGRVKEIKTDSKKSPN